MEINNIDDYMPRRVSKLASANVCELFGSGYFKHVSVYSYEDRSSARIKNSILSVANKVIHQLRRDGINLIRAGKSKTYTLMIECGLAKILTYNGLDKVYIDLLDEIAKNPISLAVVSETMNMDNMIPGRSVVVNVYKTKTFTSLVSELQFMFGKSVDMYTMAMLYTLNELSKCDGYEFISDYIFSYKYALDTLFGRIDVFLNSSSVVGGIKNEKHKSKGGYIGV